MSLEYLRIARGGERHLVNVTEEGIVVDGSLHQRITISSDFDELHRQTEGENGNMTLVWERWEYDTSVGKM